MAKNEKVETTSQTNEVETKASAPEFVWVTIPDRDLFDFPFGGVDVQLDHYGPGTHKVSPAVAADINDRLKVWREADIRVLSPKRHMRSLLQIEQNKHSGVEQVEPT